MTKRSAFGVVLLAVCFPLPGSQLQNTGGGGQCTGDSSGSCWKRDSPIQQDEFPKSDLRLVLLGKWGAGKSATGNIILGKEIFDPDFTLMQQAEGKRFGRKIQVVDAPGSFGTYSLSQDVIKEVVKCISTASPGPHAFLLVIPMYGNIWESSETMAAYQYIFGESMNKFLILVFTSIDDQTKPLEEELKNAPIPLHQLLTDFDHRWVGFSNTSTPEEKDKQVAKLLGVIDAMVSKNGGSCYTTETFEAVEKIILKREDELRRQHKEEELRRQHEEEEFRRQKLEELQRELLSEERLRRLIREEAEWGEIGRALKTISYSFFQIS